MAGVPLPGGKPGQTETPARPFSIDDWQSLNTKAKRPAIQPNEFPWIQNWMPIGPGNMRTLWDNEDPLWQAPGSAEIVAFFPFNIGADSYHAAFLDDGSAYQISVADGSDVQIGPAGTFYGAGAAEALPAAAQYQSEFLVISSEIGDDAYWVWDGTSLFGPGTIGPQVTVLNSGADYTSAPTVTAYGGSGTGATFAATVADGFLTDIEVTNPGSGYELGDKITLVITGGGSDNQARATATVSNTGGVGIVTVTAGGSAYSAPVVSFSGGGGSGAAAFVSSATSGVIVDVTVSNPGTGYTSNPTVTISDSGGGTGSGALAVCEIRRGVITGITVDNGGSGYTGAPDVIISEPDDVGFPLIQAEATAQITAGVITGITVTKGGLGYKKASVSLEGGNDAANAQVELMPFGISGTSIETYQNRVYVAEKTKGSFTGPSSLTDFSTAGGGGSFQAIDSFLRQRIVQLKQANGFLYVGGDSSVNVISNVQTSANGVTNFNNSNVDPQIGMAWRDSVAAFGRALVFANASGVYALYGGAVEKVSDALDGLFANASFNTGQAGVIPTAAVATIYGVRVYVLLLTTINPYTGSLQDMMCMWDGKRWFVGTQTLMPRLVAGQEIDSVLTSWGASDTEIFRLFQEPSSALEKIWQTKLVANPGTYVSNQVLRVYFMATVNSDDAPTMSVALENEAGANPATERQITQALIWTNDNNDVFTWSGAGGNDLIFSSRGLFVDSYADVVIGKLIGATLSTTGEDVTMLNLTLLLREYAPNA